ncbi:hypothetical protein EVAR_61322_1 [Eumeta japonica]|uniref:Uncharacterized protein n=1 Tax=Eumeta variegata TaxID=151549 RepID=A0A4C1Y4S6_EUMVA|nr:hypothetical protein EVAR_61322_1 [Eumeta japonica]
MGVSKKRGYSSSKVHDGGGVNTEYREPLIVSQAEDRLAAAMYVDGQTDYTYVMATQRFMVRGPTAITVPSLLQLWTENAVTENSRAVS